MARRVLGVFAATAAATLASLALATPAFAHNATVEAKCNETTKKSELSVDFTWYGDKQKNTIVVTVDGKEQPKITFGQNHKQSWSFDGAVAHKYVVQVTAYDDNKYSKTYNRETPACVKTPPPTKTTEQTKPPVVTTSPEAPSSSVTPPSSSTPAAPAPGGSNPEPPLAATGASPLWLLLSGVGLVGAGAGAVLLVRRRRA